MVTSSKRTPRPTSRCDRKAGVDLVARKADHDTSPSDLARSAQLVFRGVLHRHPEGVSAPSLLPPADVPPPPSATAA